MQYHLSNLGPERAKCKTTRQTALQEIRGVCLKIFILSETTNRDLRALILFGPGPLPLDGKDLIDVWFHPGMRFFPVSVSVN